VRVDGPAVGHVYLVRDGKAEVALRERIGRGLREKKVGPNIYFLTDFADDFNKYLKIHAQQRQAIIKGTPGFDRYIL
jgi:superfamily II DNA or RNA helicase